jgi:tRNA dimethylallyltransferase
MQNIPLICIVGPTASGKTRLAVQVANAVGGEIISADSRQIYRKMDIGTGKDLNEYNIAGKRIPYHLIDIVDAGYHYNVYEYQRDFQAVYTDILNRNRVPILCGGSGMYIESVLNNNYRLDYVPVNEGLRKETENYTMEELTAKLKSYKSLHNNTDILDRERLVRALEIALYYEQNPQNQSNKPINYQLFYLSFERSILREHIALRLKQRLENGMIEEVKLLLDSGISMENLFYYGLEYRFISQYLTGTMNYDTMVSKLCIAIGQFAKRQQTWFNRMKRNGFTMIEIDGSLSSLQKIFFFAKIYDIEI